MFHGRYLDGLYIVFHSVVAVMKVPEETSGACYLHDAQAINVSKRQCGPSSDLPASVEGNALRSWRWRVALRGRGWSREGEDCGPTKDGLHSELATPPSNKSNSMSSPIPRASYDFFTLSLAYIVDMLLIPIELGPVSATCLGLRSPGLPTAHT